MLATTTHDTKRSEDGRARINVISEVSDEWQAAVVRWRRINAPNCVRLNGSGAPDRNDEYLFYQSLVGAWPTDGIESAAPHIVAEAFVVRMNAYMRKAIKEAKLHTSWITPNIEYEAGVERFVRQTLTGETSGLFLDAFLPFMRRIARAGVTNSLAQLLLKLASPGVPDVYQGTELWDLSLVDPDNRRAVDWEVPRGILATLEPSLGAALGDAGARHAAAIQQVASDLLESWPDGRIKLFVTALGLRWRRSHPSLFLDGDYRPLATGGRGREHVIAFTRMAGPDLLLVVVPRLTTSLSAPDGWAVGERAWTDTIVRLPAKFGGRTFRNLLAGSRLIPTQTPRGPVLHVRDVLHILPCALLCGEPTPA